MFTTIQNHYNALVEAIIRPPRDIYVLEDLGPKRFKAGSRVWVRNDLELKNNRGMRIACSHFLPEKLNQQNPQTKWPCVIYLHGNSSSRVEAMTALEVVLPLPCTLFCFDFSGSGLSDGEYVSLGYYEKDDLACVIKYLRECGFINMIGLWGRSMGAVTSLLHADRDPSLACLVLDSPFANLRKLATELVESGQYLRMGGMLTTWVVDAGLHFIKGSVEERATFDIDDLVPIDHVNKTFVPAYFIAGSEDSFILPHHAEELWRAYAGGDKIYEVIADADHNSQRPRAFLKKIADFLRIALQIEKSALAITESTPSGTAAHHHYSSNPNISNSTTNHNISSSHMTQNQYHRNSSSSAHGIGSVGPNSNSNNNNLNINNGSTTIDKLDPEAKNAVANGIMPPHFVQVQSRSRPGTTVYEDGTTRRRYGSLAQAWRAFRQRQANPPSIQTTTSSEIQNNVNASNINITGSTLGSVGLAAGNSTNSNHLNNLGNIINNKSAAVASDNSVLRPGGPGHVINNSNNNTGQQSSAKCAVSGYGGNSSNDSIASKTGVISGAGGDSSGGGNVNLGPPIGPSTTPVPVEFPFQEDDTTVNINNISGSLSPDKDLKNKNQANGIKSNIRGNQHGYEGIIGGTSKHSGAEGGPGTETKIQY